MSAITEQVQAMEDKSSQFSWKLEAQRYVGIVVAAVIYAIGFNFFLAPLHLYAGGFMGFAQVIAEQLKRLTGFHFWDLELPGIIYYLMNIPWMIIAYRMMRRRFIFKTFLAISCISVLMTLIPVFTKPILEETIANALFAGLMCGVGLGIILRMGACDGGMNIIGMVVLQKGYPISVGQINILANILLFSYCLFVYDVSIVIYSLVFTTIQSLMIDKVHAQNINVRVLIVTNSKDCATLELEIMGQLGRGITKWHGIGAYSGQEKTILMVVASKYEVPKIRAIIHEIDTKAFVTIDEGVSVVGNFLKKLT